MKKSKNPFNVLSAEAINSWTAAMDRHDEQQKKILIKKMGMLKKRS